MRMIDADRLKDVFHLNVVGADAFDALIDNAPTLSQQTEDAYHDCEHCAKTYGTLGCCTTVSNKWVYSCEEGHREYWEKQKREQPADAISREETIHGNTYGGVSWGGTYKPQQPSEDAISRQAAIDAVKFGITYAAMIDRETGEPKELFCESNHELKKAINRICELPSVTPKAEPCEDAISRNNAITSICQWGTTLERTGKYQVTVAEMKQTCVDMLCELPSVTPKAEPCEDAISRQAVHDAIRKIGLCKCSTNEIEAVDECLRVVKALPSVTSKQRTGHWIEQEDYNLDTFYDCSECGESFSLIDGTPTDNLYNYCPNCGCAMSGKDNRIDSDLAKLAGEYADAPTLMCGA